MLVSLPTLALPAPPADGNLGPKHPAQVDQESNNEKSRETNEDQTKANDKSNSAPASVATHTRTIGIIYPSPDIRNSTNPQFHFLRPTHSMFMFFTALADAYSKALMPPKGLTDKLRNSVVDMTTVLERCLHCLEWERSQEQARQKAEDEIEQERLQMAMIDWHDFVVVEKIDFADDEDEDLPPPMTLDEVIRRSKMSAMEEEDIIEPGKEVEMDMDEEEAQLVEEGMREPPMRVVKNWKRPEERIPAERDPTKFVVSPITGELVLINEMSEHMRISLIDPKYKVQKDRMFAKIREMTLAPDDEISRNIVGLARTRPDIFGTTEEEVSNAVKAEIETKKDEQPKQVIWDGHTGSIGCTASQAMSQNIGDEDQHDASNNDSRIIPGPAPPLSKPATPSVRPLPLPPCLVLNIPRPLQYSAPTSAGVTAPPAPPGPPAWNGTCRSRSDPAVPAKKRRSGEPWPPVINMIPSIRLSPPSTPLMHGQHLMASRPPIPPSMPVTSSNIPVPPPPGSQFTPLGGPRPFNLFLFLCPNQACLWFLHHPWPKACLHLPRLRRLIHRYLINQSPRGKGLMTLCSFLKTKSCQRIRVLLASGYLCQMLTKEI
ncbi:hypothetical protein CDL12_16742 [Handroanthus impetiginosus]|uniref:Splicing factor 3A subunit 1 conserved domain-containing protein n=1 Tax=Handroanthus impetiginosus TaxID=429701 RepID=A0A2G9GZK1_9LAMI|nr:hypothetical protein CDL12_16742 [Handroanthus impetiginosus]